MNRLRASFVCRRWRRTFLQYPPLWFQLYTAVGETYMKTFLERAKGSPLSIISGYADPVGAITLLSSYTKQIKHLHFVHNHWANIQRLSEIIAGPLPLLHTITIDLVQGPGDPDM